MRAGSEGAPPHLHRRSAELFYVLDGALDVLLEDRIVTLERGDLLVVPAGTTHAFAPPADRDADVLFVFTPGTARSTTTAAGSRAPWRCLLGGDRRELGALRQPLRREPAVEGGARA